MKQHLPKILAGLLLISLFFAITLPHYETMTDGMKDENPDYISQYPNPDQSGGFFSGGFYTNYNGLGSFFALLNLGICVLLFILLFVKNAQKRFVNILLILFIGSHFLIFLGNCFAGYLLSYPTNCLLGTTGS